MSGLLDFNMPPQRPPPSSVFPVVPDAKKKCDAVTFGETGEQALYAKAHASCNDCVQRTSNDPNVPDLSCTNLTCATVSAAAGNEVIALTSETVRVVLRVCVCCSETRHISLE